MGIGRNDKIQYDKDGNPYVTGQFIWPDEKVVAELVTAEDPMTPEREKKIALLRSYGYEVVIWDEDMTTSLEKMDEAMLKLQKLLEQRAPKKRKPIF